MPAHHNRHHGEKNMDRTAKVLAQIERRLSAAQLVHSSVHGSNHSSNGGAAPSEGKRSVHSLGQRSTGKTERSDRSLMPFAEWGDDEQQRHGGAFDFNEDEGAKEPLVPHAGPIGWSDDIAWHSQVAAPEGPFAFVTRPWFLFLAGSVILANAIALFAELANADIPMNIHVLNSCFLVLYIFEIVCRIAHFRRAFFVEMPDAPWNWVDLTIVIAGILDEWVLRLLIDTEGHSQLMILRVMQPLRFLMRAMRLLRYVRLVRFLLVADLSWVESGWFQSIVGLVIVCNAAVMGFETDMESPMWWWVEEGLLIFYVAELCFRLRLSGCLFFTDPDDRGWNLLDLSIVLSGVFDQWLLGLWHSMTNMDMSDAHLGQLMMLMRMLRLMRILRLVRVVKAIRPLRQLAIGVVRAMQSMFWVLVLTFVALYSLAILTTRMIGWGQLVDDPDDIPKENREMFGTITDSMFTLFAFMNGHEWHKVRPLLDMLPWTKPLFVAFTICGSWALLSVMTGVVSDHIQYVRKEQEREDDEAREERREHLTMTLSQIFASADKDGKGFMSRDAFMDIFSSQYQVRRLQRAINQPLGDVERIFDWLDVEGRGFVSFRDFCDGLDCLEETVTGQRLLKVDSGVKLLCRTLQKDVNIVSTEVHELQTSMENEHAELMHKIHRCIASAPGEADGLDGANGVGCLLSRSLSARSGSEADFSGGMRTPFSDITPPQPTPPLKGTLRYQRSVSSLRSATSTDSGRPGPGRKMRMQKSVSFSEGVAEHPNE